MLKLIYRTNQTPFPSESLPAEVGVGDRILP